MNLCTLFDSRYLLRALAMYGSLFRAEKHFHLYILAMDDLAFSILTKLHLTNVTLIKLSSFEDDDLLQIKPSRTLGEYCWTCTPSLIHFCLKKLNLDQVTYVDADLYFVNSPAVLLDELQEKSILITEHRYTKKYDQSLYSGRFCVQFMTFKNTPSGFDCLQWWRDRCLEWCFNRHEDGKFGDQKYLDFWPEKFPQSHILNHLGGGLAPWNIQQYSISNLSPLELEEISSGVKFRPIFYHFHQFKILDHNFVDLGSYQIAQSIVEGFYSPYLQEIFIWQNKIRTITGQNIEVYDLKIKNYGTFWRFRNFVKRYVGLSQTISTNSYRLKIKRP